ncbi:MAG: hypothetical protein GY810_15500 [Aureispira sp.]|nr:hypothetical protein [Aureispira sp.]
MYKLCLILLFLVGANLVLAQKKDVDIDSFRVTIKLTPDHDSVKKATNYKTAYKSVKVKFNKLSFKYGKKKVSKVFNLPYDAELDAWTTLMPKGLYNMTIKHGGFVDQEVPMAVEDSLEEVFYLKVDSLPYTYKDGTKYRYIHSTLDFTETVFVQFNIIDPFAAKGILDGLLPTYTDISILNIQKLSNVNAFLVDFSVADHTPLPLLLYRQVSKTPAPPRGTEIGFQIAKTIELLQSAPEIEYANPMFNNTNPEFLKTDDFPKSEELEDKLLRQLEGN